MPNSAAPTLTAMCVRRPAGWSLISRSKPRAPPRRAATARRPHSSSVVGMSTALTVRLVYPAPLRLLQRRPGEQQDLLADAGEAHDRLGLVARAPDVEDHALAPLRV